MPPKVDKSKFKIRKKTGETICRMPGEIDGGDFAIMKCEDCEIYLYDHFEQVFVDDCVNCKVFIGPTRGSIFMRDCSNMKLYSASKQLRISDSKDIIACVYAGSDPALENVTGLQLAPYNFVFPDVDQHFEKASLNPQEDYWSQVFDFTHYKKVDNLPNWTLLKPEEYEGNIVRELEDVEGKLENPVPIPREYGGDSDIKIIVGSQDPGSQQDTDGMVSFSIQTSMQKANQEFEQQNQEFEQQNQEFEQQNQEFEQQNNVQQNQEQQNDFDDYGGFGGEQNQQQQQEQQDSQNQQQQQDEDFFNTNNQQQQQQSQQNYQEEEDFGYQQNQQDQNQNDFNNNNNYNYNNNNNNNNNYNDFQQQDEQEELTEEQKRKQQLKQREAEMTANIMKKQQEEQQMKNERRNQAQEWLRNWQLEREQNIIKVHQNLRENNDILKEQKNKEQQNITNQWSIVTENIPLKQSDYKGSTDITPMKNAIMNKKKDIEQQQN